MTEKPSQIELFMYVIKVSVILGAGVFFIWLFVNMRPIVDTHGIETTANQLADHFASSQEITYQKSVFSMSKLDDLMKNVDTIDPGTYFGNAYKNYEMPDVRQCKYAYHFKIEDITGEKIWEFGYMPQPTTLIKQYSASYDVSLLSDLAGSDNYKESVIPAKLSLTLYDSWLTEVGCLAEQAYKMKEIRTMTIPCIRPEVDEIVDKKLACTLPIRNKDDDRGSKYICLYSNANIGKKDFNCRYDDVPIVASYIRYQDSSIAHTLKAIPVKKGDEYAVGGENNVLDCSNMKDPNFIAGPQDNVYGVLLCVD